MALPLGGVDAGASSSPRSTSPSAGRLSSTIRRATSIGSTTSTSTRSAHRRSKRVNPGTRGSVFKYCSRAAHGIQRPSPRSRSASSTISRSTPAGLASRVSEATRSTSGSVRASSHAPPRRHVTKSSRSSSYIASEPGGRRRIDRARLPQPHRARERDEHADVRRLAAEARRQLLHEGFRRPDPRSHVVPRLAPGEREPHRERHRIRRELRPPGRVVLRLDEVSHLLAPLLALGEPRRADDRGHFGRDDVTVRVHGHEEPAPLERKSDATARGGRPCRGAQAQRFALELEELLRVRFAPFVRDRLEHAPLRAGELLDLLPQLLRIAQDLPGRLERERDGRRRRPAEVVRRDRAHRLERRLREERANAARVFPLPRPQLNEVGRREHELDARFVGLVAAAREDEPAREERLERRRNRGHEERPARLRDAVEKLDARGRKARRIARLRQRHEEARHLRRRVEPLGRIDPNPQARHERIQLGRGERAENIDESVGGSGARSAVRQGGDSVRATTSGRAASAAASSTRKTRAS